MNHSPSETTTLYATSYATGTDSWSAIPYHGELTTMVSCLPHNSLILDIGCGRGGAARTLAGLGYRVVGIDMIQSAVDRATSTIHDASLDAYAKFMVADATNMPFTDHSFDAAVMIGVLHHEEAPMRSTLLDQVLRVVKPGGYFISMELSRETGIFGDFRPRLSTDGDMVRFGMRYHFFDATELETEVTSHNMVCIRQEVVTYKTNSYGAHELSFLWSLFQIKQNEAHESISRETPVTPLTV